MLFSLLSYSYLQSEYVVHSEQQKTSTAVEALRAKAKFLRTCISGELVFSHRRCSKAAKICIADRTRSIDKDTIDHPWRNVVLFSRKMFIRVLIVFIGNLPKLESESETKLKFVKEIISTLARLDVSLAKEVACPCSDGTGKVGGHLQELDHDTFASYL